MIELEENIKLLENLKNKLLEIKISMKIEDLKKDLDKLEKKSLEENFWQDTENSNKVFSKIKTLQKKINNYKNLESELKNLIEMNTLLEIEKDDDLLKELLFHSLKLKKDISNLEIQTLFSGKYDNSNAIISLHPGAGGTESQDWVQMLYRMYGRWANANGFLLKELDYLDGEE